MHKSLRLLGIYSFFVHTPYTVRGIHPGCLVFQPLPRRFLRALSLSSFDLRTQLLFIRANVSLLVAEASLNDERSRLIHKAHVKC